MLLELQVREQRFSEAVRLIDRMAPEALGWPRIARAAALAYANTGQADAAVRVARRAVERSPEDAISYLGLG